MATIVTINAGDLISDSRADLNTNFENLNSDKIETSTLDTDTTLAANSDSKIPTQKAVKAYVDAGGNANASTTQAGIVEEATAAEVAAGTATGGSGARLFMNPSTAGTKFATTQVFSGTSPTSMTDLDLSSVVGVAQRVVLLKLTSGDASSIIAYFRRNGETGTVGSAGASTASAGNSTYIAYAVVATDTSGVVEWMTSAARTCTVNVEAYW